MTENNSQELDHIREHYQSLNKLQHEQLIALRKENHELRLKLTFYKQRKINQKKEYEEKIEKLQILVNDAGSRLNEGSDLIRKLQKHLKICQEKLSSKSKALLAKNESLCEYQLHINHLNDMIKQLIDESTAQHLQYSLNFNDNQKIDVGIQTSPTLSSQRRCVRFNLDKENCPIDAKYFQPTTLLNKRSR